MTEGREIIKHFLIVIQTYKASGCFERAKPFYDKYSEVNDFFLKIRTIVMSKLQPRRVELNDHIVRYNEECVEPVCYPENFEGIITSY